MGSVKHPRGREGSGEGRGSARLRPGPRVVDSGEIHRRRLMDAMVLAVSAEGYAATTIGDVVRTAQVSRRTFYELFNDKEDCFVAAFASRTDRLLEVVDRAVAGRGDWRGQLLAGFGAYLSALADDLAATRVFLIEALGAGERALAGRRRVHDRWAQALCDLVHEARRADPAVAEITRDLPPVLAQAVVGAVHELVLVAVEQDRGAEIPQLRFAAADLLHRVVYARLPEPARPSGAAEPSGPGTETVKHGTVRPPRDGEQPWDGEQPRDGGGP